MDSKEAVLDEALDIIAPIRKGLISEDHTYAELGEIVLGNKPDRTNPKELTVFGTVFV